jgi:hypothetical protein
LELGEREFGLNWVRMREGLELRRVAREEIFGWIDKK